MAEVGRPCDYNSEILEKTKAYIENYEDEGDVIPSIAGLSCVLGKSRSTIYKWKSDNVDQEFSDTLDLLLAHQERKCLNKGLDNTFNSAITKLVLGNHGYGAIVDITDNEDSPPIAYTFEVKEAKGEIKTTNAKS